MRSMMLRYMRMPAWQSWGLALPGAGLCVLIAMAASFVASLQGGTPMLYALLFGTALHYLHAEVRTAPGVRFCAGTLLRLGVGLLGARITLSQIAALGWPTVLITILGAASTLLAGVALARRLRLPASLGVLAGGATAICGASAAMAIAAVLPQSAERERETLSVVVLATLLSTVAMLAYPLAASFLHLPPALAGLFIGGSIHDVAQVVVAGYALGNETGDAASVVKLLRVSLLALVVMGVALAFRQRGGAALPASSRPPLVPGFVLLFLAMAAWHSLGLLPVPLQAGLGQASQACLTVGVAALGMKTSFLELTRSGRRTALLMGFTTAWIGFLMLGGALWLRMENP
ncbi:putative sulfate exporter family transporter [Polaromonas sp.]|uniref:YeiH family protein n=1 Tax=Polaromonas sp. TaxID=1869339 RepID=UPI003266614C